jgi:glycopeptide antibiotics resistance protein
MISILTFIIISCTWFISALPFLIPYHILLTIQSKKFGYNLSIQHIIIVYIFVYYLTGMLSFTGTYTIFRNRLNIPPSEINLIPFRWIADGFRTYIENILLFVPFGFLLPCIWKKYESLLKTALTGFAFSLIIELSQLLNRNRVTDIDDLIMNTLGVFIGWAIFRLLREHFTRLKDKFAIQYPNIPKLPLLLREEPYFYMAGAFAGMLFVYNPFLVYPLLNSLLY